MVHNDEIASPVQSFAEICPNAGKKTSKERQGI